MKRLLLWLIGVALGVAVLLAAVMSVSYSFTSEGAKPASAVQFAGQELEPNGWCWQVPLLGGQLDKVFASPRTLTVQNVVFTGTVPAYEDFLFPANGDYKAELTLWRMPETMLATQFEGGSTGQLRRNPRLEKPAKPTGWYYYSFRFTLQASAGVELSADRVAWWAPPPLPWKQTSAACRPSAWAAGGVPTSRRPTTPPPVPTK